MPKLWFPGMDAMAISITPLLEYTSNFTTLLMATGLTFGTISALFGLHNKIIDERQYKILVTVVILSALVPTLIAQKFFQPTIETMVQWRHACYDGSASALRELQLWPENKLPSSRLSGFENLCRATLICPENPKKRLIQSGTISKNARKRSRQ